MTPAPLPPRGPGCEPLDVTALLERIDPLHEWRNPEAHLALMPLLETLGDYGVSQGYFRGLRPDATTAQDGHAFWANPLSRAHLVNAYLRRDTRPTVVVESELGFPPGKIYTFFRRTNLEFESRRRQTGRVIALDGDGHDAEIVAVEHDDPRFAALRVAGYPGTHVGRWSRSSHAFRLQGPLPRYKGLIPITSAARELRLNAARLRQTLSLVGWQAGTNAYVDHVVKVARALCVPADGSALELRALDLAYLAHCRSATAAVRAASA